MKIILYFITIKVTIDTQKKCLKWLLIKHIHHVLIVVQIQVGVMTLGLQQSSNFKNLLKFSTHDKNKYKDVKFLL